MKKHGQIIETLDKQIDEAMKKVDEHSKSAAVKKQVADTQAALNAYDPIREKITAFVFAGKRDEAIAFMREPPTFRLQWRSTSRYRSWPT